MSLLQAHDSACVISEEARILDWPVDNDLGVVFVGRHRCIASGAGTMPHQMGLFFEGVWAGLQPLLIMHHYNQ